MKKGIFILALLLCAMASSAKTLIVYYSYTNNVEKIVTELRTQIDADVIEIQPAEKGLDYAANNYAIGSAQISAIRQNPTEASSYPGIDPVSVNLADYDCIIIGAPLWWSSMAAPLQTFLFEHGSEMAGKKIGLIVSSHSSGINGVEADAKRLIHAGDFLSPSLWIRSSQVSDAESLLADWLKDIDYDKIAAGVSEIREGSPDSYTVYFLNGTQILDRACSINSLTKGIYIVNGKKTLVGR